MPPRRRTSVRLRAGPCTPCETEVMPGYCQKKPSYSIPRCLPPGFKGHQWYLLHTLLQNVKEWHRTGFNTMINHMTTQMWLPAWLVQANELTNASFVDLLRLLDHLLKNGWERPEKETPLSAAFEKRAIQIWAGMENAGKPVHEAMEQFEILLPSTCHDTTVRYITAQLRALGSHASLEVPRVQWWSMLLIVYLHTVYPQEVKTAEEANPPAAAQ